MSAYLSRRRRVRGTRPTRFAQLHRVGTPPRGVRRSVFGLHLSRRRRVREGRNCRQGGSSSARPCDRTLAHGVAELPPPGERPARTCHAGGAPGGPGAGRLTVCLSIHRTRAGGCAARTGLRRRRARITRALAGPGRVAVTGQAAGSEMGGRNRRISNKKPQNVEGGGRTDTRGPSSRPGGSSSARPCDRTLAHGVAELPPSRRATGSHLSRRRRARRPRRGPIT
jgi:hypothetical protein